MEEYMVKDDYVKLLALQDRFGICLVSCAQEISEIFNGRKLVGEFTGDLDLYCDGKYYVEFEELFHGEYAHDGIYVPFEYIYDEEYREYYKKFLIEERARKRQEAIEREEERKRHTYRIITDERAEYERLKTKFEDE